MKCFRLICFVSFFLVFNTLSYANETSYWIDKLESSSLEEVSKVLVENNTYAWPKIDIVSLKDLNDDERRNQEKLLELAGKLFKKIKGYNSQYKSNDVPSLFLINNTLIKISKVLRNKGGYVNYVLTDTCYRIILVRSASYLMNNQNNIQPVRDILDSFPAPFKPDEIIQLLEDNGFNAAKDGLSDVKPNDYLAEISEILGVQKEELLRILAFDNLKTSRLINNKDLFGYIYRILNTHLFAAVALSGTIEYIEKGGVYQDVLYGSDMTKFKNIMGENRGKYQFFYLGVKKLYPHHISYMFDSFMEDYINAEFFRIGNE